MTLKEGNVVYNIWENPEVHNIVSMYGFNYTNYENAIAMGVKLRVEQVGPYAFR